MHAFQRGGRGGKAHGLAGRKTPAERDGIGTVENISRARGVHNIHWIGRLFVQSAVFVPAHALMTARDRENAAIKVHKLRQLRIVSRSGESYEGRLREYRVVSQRQETLEDRGVGDISIENGRDPLHPRLGEERHRSFSPPRPQTAADPPRHATATAAFAAMPPLSVA